MKVKDLIKKLEKYDPDVEVGTTLVAAGPEMFVPVRDIMPVRIYHLNLKKVVKTYCHKNDHYDSIILS